MANLSSLEKEWGDQRADKFTAWVKDFFEKEVGVAEEGDRKELLDILDRNKLKSFYSLALASQVPRPMAGLKRLAARQM